MGRTAGQIVGLVAVVVAVVSVIAAWATPRPDVDLDDARELTADAFAEVGVAVAEVREPLPCFRAEAGVDDGLPGDPVCDREPDDDERTTGVIETWETQVVTDDGDLMLLSVRRDDGTLIFLDDVTPEGSQVLTDEQFAELKDHDGDPASDRRRDRNIAASAAGAVLAAVGVLVIVRARRRPQAQQPGPEVDDDPAEYIRSTQ